MWIKRLPKSLFCLLAFLFLFSAVLSCSKKAPSEAPIPPPGEARGEEPPPDEAAVPEAGGAGLSGGSSAAAVDTAAADSGSAAADAGAADADSRGAAAGASDAEVAADMGAGEEDSGAVDAAAVDTAAADSGSAAEKTTESPASLPMPTTMAQQIKQQLKLKTLSVSDPAAPSAAASSASLSEEPLGTPSSFVNAKGHSVHRKRVGQPSSARQANLFAFKSFHKPLLPSDFRIGALADLQTTEVRTRQVFLQLQGFVTALAREKRVDPRYILPDSLALIQNNMSYYIESGALPDSLFRMGQVVPDNHRVRVNVRFYLGDGVTDGEVVLDEIDRNGKTQWLISDLQVDFAKLLLPYPGFSEPFIPSSYQLFDWES